MVYKLEDVRSDRGAESVTDRITSIPSRHGVCGGACGDPDPARIAELLAQIGALGARIDAAAQRSVDALRQVRGEPGIDAWDRATADSLLQIAARIEAGRQRLDAALECDRVRLTGARGSVNQTAPRRRRWTRSDQG